MSGSKFLKVAKPVLLMQIAQDAHSYKKKSKTWQNMECAQAMILEYCSDMP
jgi:hypothetical protein